MATLDGYFEHSGEEEKKSHEKSPGAKKTEIKKRGKTKRTMGGKTEKNEPGQEVFLIVNSFKKTKQNAGSCGKF